MAHKLAENYNRFFGKKLITENDFTDPTEKIRQYAPYLVDIGFDFPDLAELDEEDLRALNDLMEKQDELVDSGQYDSITDQWFEGGQGIRTFTDFRDSQDALYNLTEFGEEDSGELGGVTAQILDIINKVHPTNANEQVNEEELNEEEDSYEVRQLYNAFLDSRDIVKLKVKTPVGDTKWLNLPKDILSVMIEYLREEN